MISYTNFGKGLTKKGNWLSSPPSFNYVSRRYTGKDVIKGVAGKAGVVTATATASNRNPDLLKTSNPQVSETQTRAQVQTITQPRFVKKQEPQGPFKNFDMKTLQPIPNTKDTQQFLLESDRKRRAAFLIDNAKSQRDAVVNKILPIIKEHSNNLAELVKANVIQIWSDYLEKRGSILPLNDDEREIHYALKRLLPENNFETTLDSMRFKECFLPEDWEDQILQIKQNIAAFESNNMDFYEHALISSTITKDQEGGYKLTRETYQLLHEKASDLGIKYTNHKPDVSYIIDCLKNKRFIIIDGSKTLPPNAVLSTAPLLHKSIMIKYMIERNKMVNLRIGMFTSAKDENTFQLSKTQEINQDPAERSKTQMFRIFYFFVIADDVLLVIDSNATKFAQGLNLEGEDVLNILIEHFQQSEPNWSNNFIQEPFIITEEVLRKLTKLSYEKVLHKCEQKLDELKNYLKALPDDTARKAHRAKLKKDKDDYLGSPATDKYYSSLSSECQMLHQAERSFEFYLERDEELKVKKNLALAMQEALEKFKQNNKPTPQPAKEKREEYIKKKNEQEESFAKKNEQATVKHEK